MKKSIVLMLFALAHGNTADALTQALAKPVFQTEYNKSDEKQSLLTRLKSKFTKKRCFIAAAATAGLATTAFIGLKVVIPKVVVPAVMMFQKHQHDWQPDRGTYENYLLKNGVPLEPKTVEDTTDILHYNLLNAKTTADNAPLIINLVGNKGRSCAAQDQLQPLTERTGCPILTTDYPGVNGSPGWPWSVNHCAKKICQQYHALCVKNPTLKNRRVIVVGHSLGGYIGTLVAKELQCPLFIDRSLCSVAKVAKHQPIVSILPEKLIKAGTWLSGFEIDMEKELKAMAANGQQVCIVNHRHDGMMAPHAFILHDLTKPRSIQIENLTVLEAHGWEGVPHCNPRYYVKLITQNRAPLPDTLKNQLLAADECTLEDALVAFVKTLT